MSAVKQNGPKGPQEPVEFLASCGYPRVLYITLAKLDLGDPKLDANSLCSTPVVPLKPLTGKYTIEQAGTDNCVTFDAANNALEDDRLFTSRCREGLREGTQNFTVITDRNNGHFSLATEDQKCFYADTNKDIRRDKSFCSKTLSYFVAQRAGSSSILVKEWPSNSCLNANLDGTLNFEACDSGSQRQTWKVCRSDDPSICLRNYPL
ncbi:hypothetical protein RvY_10248 [Ramazzottius varieornatus]|uniref:Ricin B lectin domain-containing protein n=1 Tax=Ramazzottius varieornatus TaxID=947166 RepID=A0A1D1VC56_RAMVA|nr:hypothetical protein RvY_10248 [Ramazzottius varieornatus]